MTTANPNNPPAKGGKDINSDLARAIVIMENRHSSSITGSDFVFVIQTLTSAREELGRLKDRPRIICLCGSTRFMGAFFDAGWDFTLQGYIVLSIGVCKHADKEGGHGAGMLGQDVADKLDELHLRKIDLADEVFILNVGGYIGDSTRKELEYAQSLEKPIRFLEAPDE